MIRIRFITAVVIISSIALACQKGPINSWQPKSLLEYGLPVTVLVPNPDSVVVKKDDLGPIQDITVDGGEGYYLQIYASTAESNDVAKLKSEQLDMVKEQKYFSRVVSEEEAGFIYENLIDSVSSFGFRFVQVKGDKEIVFQNHLSRLFSQAAIEKMYNAVQPQDYR